MKEIGSRIQALERGFKDSRVLGAKIHTLMRLGFGRHG